MVSCEKLALGDSCFNAMLAMAYESALWGFVVILQRLQRSLVHHSIVGTLAVSSLSYCVSHKAPTAIFSD